MTVGGMGFIPERLLMMMMMKDRYGTLKKGETLIFQSNTTCPYRKTIRPTLRFVTYSTYPPYLEVWALQGWLQVVLVHVCTLAILLGNLELTIAILWG